MKLKIIGYIVSILGLVVIALSIGLGSINVESLSGFKPAYTIVAGLVLVIVGVSLVISKNKTKQQADEVPIYEGEGKKRKIVGYKRQKK